MKWKAKPSGWLRMYRSGPNLPGFRPGKVPASLVRKTFAGDIRQKVLEVLVPKYLQQHLDADNLTVVGRPDVSDVHLHEGEPLTL